MKNIIKLIGIIAGVAIIIFSIAGCELFDPPPEVVTINIKAIAGVTAPVQGATPVTAITENAQYTGTVTWNGTPSAFVYNTVYTATITLTAKEGYTLDGVTENFFTVAGANPVNNAANSGVVTAIFPQTGSDPSLPDLSGDITIEPSTGVTIGTELTATYSGDEEVSFQWQKDGINIGTASTENPNTYTPLEDGSYTVIVSLEGHNSKSATVTIITADLSGNITITPNTDVNIGTLLTATYSGDEAVSFQWKKDGVDVGTASTTNPNTYTPTEDGSYTVTVSAEGFKPKTSDPVTVTIPANYYIITGEASSFTAQKGGVTIASGTGAIQAVINAIRTDADGEPVSIQFVGTGESALNIGTASAQFTNDTGSTWGLIILLGKITSTNATATEGTVLIGAGVSVNSIADIAVTSTGANGRAIYKTGAGTVSISGGTVSATTGNAVYVAGADTEMKISGGTVSATSGYAVYITGTSTDTEINISGGTVSVTTGYAVYNAGTSTVKISSGTVSATSYSGSALYNASSGEVNISGGTVSADGYYAVYNAGTGTVKISGGNLSATSGNAVLNSNTGTVNISGGELSATTGPAVRNSSTGKITVSGNALITSANTSTTAGTIYISSAGSTNIERLSITGGTVRNTSTGNAISNESTGAVSVSGSTISAPLGFAILSTNSNAALTLSGTPIITGNLRAPAGKLSVTDFIPGSNKYSLDFASYTAGAIAVTGGGDFGNNFSLFYQRVWKLAISDDNLVIAADTDPSPGTYSYTITTSGSNFTAQKGSATIANGTGAIQDVINAIRADAFGRDVSIQFGGGSDTLNIGTDSAQFTNAGGYWGSITLSGKITSANITSTEGTVMIGANISVDSTADIANSASNLYARAMYIGSSNSQIINIKGGTIAATGASGRALYINGASTVNISSGTTVSATSGYAVYNGNSNCTVNITGGTVMATTGQAVHNYFNGPVNISGGTVSATTGQAVYNDYNGTITVSGNATVTSANTGLTSGTIYVSTSGTTADTVRVAITGGTVRNTASGNAVYNASVGTVNISGGTVSATVTAYAVLSSTTSTTANNAGAITLSGDPDIIGMLRPAATGKLTVTAAFNPSATRSYVLDYATAYYVAGNIAVTGGASSAARFSLNTTAWKLEVKDNDLVIAANP